MRIEGQRRSTNFEDRGRGRGGGGGVGIPVQALAGLARLLGVKGILIAALLFGVAFLFMPAALTQQILAALTGGGVGPAAGPGAANVCEASQANGEACDFSRVVLASTEDVWTPLFARGELPEYGPPSGPYRHPTLVVYANAVSTGGCGNATSAVGPFYCPADQRLYLDPSFYRVMEQRLHAPGDFAQAYVIAHEVGHHVQGLIGAMRLEVPGESSNQTSVRVELQADCLAGVWGRSALTTLEITNDDLGEALNAAHAIGDDNLGLSNERQFTHGSSEQRQRWFKRGFDSGDARQCDTFAVRDYRAL